MKKPDIKIDFSQFERSNRGTSWQKAVFGAILVSLCFYLSALAYLYFRPLSPDIKASIDSEVSSSNITFDQKTIEMLKNRQQPPANTTTIGAKNPFTPF
jgi:hypothetical protein